jgi:hypothetical protein
MKNRAILVLCGLAVLAVSTAYLGTDDPVALLLKQMDTYKLVNPQEKVYLHLDQPRYPVGSDVWFSAYVVNADEGGRSKLSGVLHVALISPQDSILIQKKLLLTNGLAAGDFNLPDTLQEGIYRIRAYTQLMRNAGPAFFFDQAITIGDWPATDGVAKGPIPIQIEARFFPEGGSLVEGISSKIGIKTVNGSGLGAAVVGRIVDQTGRKLASFRTGNSGLGTFTLNPKAGAVYLAKVETVGGSTAEFPLPLAKPSGHVLAVDHLDSNQLSLRIFSTPSLLTGKELKLVVQHNTNILFVFKALIREPEIQINVDRKQLPSGIIHLTLFSENMEPLAERLVFNRNIAEELETRIVGLKESYTAGAALEFELGSLLKGVPEAAIYSMAISNSDLPNVSTEKEANILGSLLLCADLSDYIENPNIYFADHSKETEAAIDNLLLTQVWSRFSWLNVLTASPKKPEFSAEKNLKVSGTLLSLDGKRAVRGKVSLFAPDKGSFVLDTLTDAAGRFNYDNLVFEDGTRFVLQATDEKGRQNVQIKLDPQADPVPTTSKYKAALALLNKESTPTQTNQNKPALAQSPNRTTSSEAIRLKEVRIKSKKRTIMQSSNLNGAGVADQILQEIDIGTCINLLQCLKGRVSGYVLRNDTPFLVRSPKTPMMLSLDGVLIDGARLRDLNPGEIESIEVLKNPINTAVYGIRGLGGVLVINTKKGKNNQVIRYKPWIVTHLPVGFATSRTFPSEPTASQNSGTRGSGSGTIYWNPRISTGKAGPTKMIIKVNRVPGNYRIVLEGITEKGELGRTVYNYSVK